MNSHQNPDEHVIDEQSALESKAKAFANEARTHIEKVSEADRDDYMEYIEFLEGQVERTRVSYQKDRASSELQQHLIQWDAITLRDVRSLEVLLKQGPDEQALHHHLEENPKLLIQTLAGGHGRYLISKKRLGSQFVTDFLMAEEHSMGLEWHAIELESPLVKAHRQDGQQTQELTHAICQIRDWRSWIMDNLDYARRPCEQNGLGLIGIDNRVSGLIIIGRRSDFPERYNEFRRQMIDRERIAIHSYDWLVDVARSNRSGSLSFGLRNDQG